MSVGKEKLDEINNEDMKYDGEDDNLQRTRRENDVTVVEDCNQSWKGSHTRVWVNSYNFLWTTIRVWINK